MSFNEWKKYKLGELVEVAQGLAINAKSKHLLQDSGLPLLRITDLINNTQVQFINVAGAPKQSLAEYDDIIYTRTGQVGLVFKGKRGIIHNNCFKVIPNKTVLDSIFLYYFLYQTSTKELANSIASGSVQKDLPHSSFKSIEINVPSIQTQQRIASILCSLDDKIELNRQTNKTLETIAQTLFKEMCLPKGEELPEGWIVGRLKDVLEIKYGKDHKHLDNGSIPLYGSGGIMRHVDKALYENESILIPRKGTLSNLFYINKPFWSVDTMFYSKIKKQYHGKFLFHLLQSLNLASMNVGSAVPSLTTEILNDIEINIPPQDILKEFDDLVTPIFQNIEANEDESNTLATLRDSLLPKLMKGEIQV